LLVEAVVVDLADQVTDLVVVVLEDLEQALHFL
jgi:hypothetical protein